MRILFMGTPMFSVPSLRRLYDDGHDIVGVFSQPDKPRGRGMKTMFTPVKELAISSGTQVFQPMTLSDGKASLIIKELCCDLIVVVAYGRLLPREILDLPPLGCINIHASLLPKYRGAAPINWAIIRGEKETGVTAMQMDEELDSGDIICCSKTDIGESETAGQLYERLSVIGANLLSETITVLSSGIVVRTPQDHDVATYAPPINRRLSPIDWSDTSENIRNKVRGLNPRPSATTKLNDVVFKIHSVVIGGSRPQGVENGAIVATGRQGIEITCADGTVIIKELQAPGGRRMTAEEYLRGNRV